MAVQIAKLRFFVSLVVEQKLDEARGKLTPLPNLETKIVAANILLPIPRTHRQGDLFANPAVAAKEAELREANASHFAAKRFSDKRKRKARILRLRNELVALLKADHMLRDPKDADRMAAWDPFDQNRHADFFDPEWMYGFSQGFDVVLGNPPYVRQEAIKDDKARLKPHYDCYSGTADLFVYFYERAFQLLNPHGVLSFITSNKWVRAKYGEGLRRYMVSHTEMRQIIDFGDEAVFDALAYPTIIIASKRLESDLLKTARNDVLALNWDSNNPAHQVAHFPEVFAAEHFAVPQAELKIQGWQLEPPTNRRLLERVRKAGQPLGDYCQGHFYYGIKTGLNEAFVIDREWRDALIAQDPKSAEIIKPFLRGRDVKRWRAESQDLWLIFTRRGVDIDAYQAIKRHLQAFREQLEPKPSDWNDKKQGAWPGRKAGSYEWFHIQDNIAYWEQFEAPKIVIPAITATPIAAVDRAGHYSNNKSTIFIPPSIAFAAACVNSPIAAWIAVQTFATKQGGFFDFEPRYSSQIPVPNTSTSQLLVVERIVDAILLDIAATEYERLLNGLVYELFFPEDLHAKGIRLFDACAQAGIPDWPTPPAETETSPAAQQARVQFTQRASATATEIFQPSHPIYGMLFELQAVEVVRIIEGVA